MGQGSPLSYRSRRCSGIRAGRFAFVAAFSILIVIGSLPADSVARAARSAVESLERNERLPDIAGGFVFALDTGDDEILMPVDESPNDRFAGWDICEREVEMYVGKSNTLVPTPKHNRGETVHGVAPVRTTAHPDIGGVSADGELGAYAPGRTMATMRTGFSERTVEVAVYDGRRSNLPGEVWDEQQGFDCLGPDVPPEPEKLLSPGGYVEG